MIQIEIIKSNIDFFIENLKESIGTDESFENILICISKLIMTTSNNLKEIKYNFESINHIFRDLHQNYKGSNRLKYKLLDLCEYIEKINKK
jgi:hypothetical protein